ncbi:MAG: hypothetical protein IMW89_01555 [Ktedonobacteraceae bacterium]|nr:hypothetical protein [Ktedonobacteraceae bacterium]
MSWPNIVAGLHRSVSKKSIPERGQVLPDLPRSGYCWLALLLVICCLVAGCGGAHRKAAPPTPVAAPGSADAIILAMLNNIKENGYNANPAINDSLGGLWINWRYGTRPLQTNLNGSGFADGPERNPPRHDQLTDLRYLHALWLYKSLHPADTQFDGELKRYTAIVKHEFARPENERGWLYDLLIDLYQLSDDAFYRQAARSLAHYFASVLYHPDSGLSYRTSPDHPRGYYRVDLALEQGCALIQAGTLFNEPGWRAAGLRLVEQVYAAAYLPRYHVLLYQLDNVLLPDGRANPNPTIFRGLSGHTKIEGGSIRLGAVAQEILSLLHVYIVTHDVTFLNRATDLLSPLTVEQNSLGLWDREQSGYFAGATFKGPDRQHAGEPRVNRKFKESGRQLQLLEAFRVANTVTHDRYLSMQQALLHLAVGKAYYAPGRGVLYQVTADWQPVRLKNGQVQDWVTTEAMGIALEGLFSLQKAHPW